MSGSDYQATGIVERLIYIGDGSITIGSDYYLAPDRLARVIGVAYETIDGNRYARLTLQAL